MHAQLLWYTSVFYREPKANARWHQWVWSISLCLYKDNALVTLGEPDLSSVWGLLQTPLPAWVENGHILIPCVICFSISNILPAIWNAIVTKGNKNSTACLSSRGREEGVALKWSELQAAIPCLSCEHFPQDLPENWATVFWCFRSPSERSVHVSLCDMCHIHFTCYYVTCVAPSSRVTLWCVSSLKKWLGDTSISFSILMKEQREKQVGNDRGNSDNFIEHLRRFGLQNQNSVSMTAALVSSTLLGHQRGLCTCWLDRTEVNTASLVAVIFTPPTLFSLQSKGFACAELLPVDSLNQTGFPLTSRAICPANLWLFTNDLLSGLGLDLAHSFLSFIKKKERKKQNQNL